MGETRTPVTPQDREAVVQMYRDGPPVTAIKAKFSHLPHGTICTILFEARKKGLVDRRRLPIGRTDEGLRLLATIAVARAGGVRWTTIADVLDTSFPSIRAYAMVNNRTIFDDMMARYEASE